MDLGTISKSISDNVGAVTVGIVALGILYKLVRMFVEHMEKQSRNFTDTVKDSNAKMERTVERFDLTIRTYLRENSKRADKLSKEVSDMRVKVAEYKDSNEKIYIELLRSKKSEVNVNVDGRKNS